EEVEGVVEGRPRRAPAGAVERIRTRLTLLQDDRLYYRGHDVVELADRGFEQSANLLWDNENPWPSAGVDATTTAVIRTAGGPRARGLDLIRLTVDVLGARDPHR
ncbi:citrate synthase, partial [Streptomyces sp. SID10244]|nr:citrate synthase [Streptomyces sp. SID10244]